MTPIKIKMSPVTPGEFVKGNILPDELSVAGAAHHLGISRQSLYALLNDNKSITAEMAKRFELAFGVDAAILINHQAIYDAWKAEQRASELAESVTPFSYT